MLKKCTNKTLNKIKGGLVVSCQGLDNEPMHSPFIMGRFALAAKMGGAVGIRANTVKDIHEIKKNVKLPIIGIIKKQYKNNPVYITPTIKEVDVLVKEGVDIVAVDATKRSRPDKITLKEFVTKIRSKYKNIILMADISDFDEAIEAQKLGFDIVGTTLRSYTSYTKTKKIPDFEFIKKLVKNLNIPVIAEGGINEPQQLKQALALGCWCAVVGGAITRPQNITKRFVDSIKKS